MTDKLRGQRYDENPFLDGMMVPVKGQRVQLSRLGKDSDVLMNELTGEMRGTHVTTWKKVDSEQFVKLFTANIAMTFNLKAAGIKAFNVLLWSVQSKGLEKDLIPLDKIVLDAFLESQKDREPPARLSMPTFWRGLAELEQAQIIAKHVRQGFYYINPAFVFNGDRIAFTTMIERDKPKESNA